MTKKRFTIHGDMVSDTDMKIPITLWSDKKQQKKFCDELNALHEENEKLKQLNIPVNEIKDTVVDYRGRIVGVYYND